jgi:hypothetical protein
MRDELRLQEGLVAGTGAPGMRAPINSSEFGDYVSTVGQILRATVGEPGACINS